MSLQCAADHLSLQIAERHRLLHRLGLLDRLRLMHRMRLGGDVRHGLRLHGHGRGRHAAAHDVVHQLLKLGDVFLHIEEHLIEDLALAREQLTVLLRPTDRHRQMRGLNVGQIGAQPVGVDGAFRLKDGEALGDVLQFAHVAGPAVGEEQLAGVVLQPDGRHAILLGRIAGELAEEQQDVIATVAQWRDDDGHRVEAVIQILAEAVVGHGVDQVHVRGGHDADVRLEHLRRSDLDEFAALQHTQQACLGRDGQLAHLVEEDGAAVGHFEVALAVGQCAGERSLLVSEQLRIDRALGDGAAVDGDVCTVFAVAVLVDDLREVFLAHAALARDQHGEVGGSHLHGHVDGAVERRVVTDDPEALLDLLYGFFFHIWCVYSVSFA